MKPELQRIAIAEEQGWRCCHDSSKYGLGVIAFPPNYDGDLNNTIGLQKIPDYLNDLNAMHEAVMAQSGEFRLRYRNALVEIAGSQHYHNATAAQRAEAFLKTLNLWKP